MQQDTNTNWLAGKWKISEYETNPNDFLRVRQSRENKTAIMKRITNLLGVQQKKFTPSISDNGFQEAYASCDIQVSDQITVNLQVSTDSIKAYLKDADPNTVPLFGISVYHVRFSGSANDVLLDEIAQLTVDILWFSMMNYKKRRENYKMLYVEL